MCFHYGFSLFFCLRFYATPLPRTEPERHKENDYVDCAAPGALSLGQALTNI